MNFSGCGRRCGRLGHSDYRTGKESAWIEAIIGYREAAAGRFAPRMLSQSHPSACSADGENRSLKRRKSQRFFARQETTATAKGRTGARRSLITHLRGPGQSQLTSWRYPAPYGDEANQNVAGMEKAVRVGKDGVGEVRAGRRVGEMASVVCGLGGRAGLSRSWAETKVRAAGVRRSTRIVCNQCLVTAGSRGPGRGACRGTSRHGNVGITVRRRRAATATATAYRRLKGLEHKRDDCL